MNSTTPINGSILNFTLFLLAAILIGWLLVVGRDLLLPLVLAVIIWYILDSLAITLQKLTRKWFKLPYWVAMLGSFIVCGILSIFIINMVIQNATELSKQLPTYQANFEAKIKHLIALVAPNANVSLDLLHGMLAKYLNPQTLIAWTTTVLSSAGGLIAVITIYLIFIFFENKVFEQKFVYLFNSPEKRARAVEVHERIKTSISTYLGVKTFISAISGTLSALILMLIGIDYPVFWGFLIFLLNYIPNIGSLLGVAFPALLSLVQFDTSWQFFLVIIVLGITDFSVGNFFEPRMMGHSLNLSGLAILISLAIWGAMWGIIGMVLSVPITVIMLIIFSEFPTTRPIAVLLSSDGKI